MIFRAISLAVGIRTPAADLEDELSRLTAFLPSLPPRTPLDLEYQIEKIQDEYRIARKGASFEAQKRETVFGVIQKDLSYELAESRAFGLIHAATLLRDGRALLLPGPSGSGKTSVCAALLKPGTAALRILAQTVNGHVLEEKGFSVAADLVQAVACRDLELGEIREEEAAVERIWEGS